MKPTIYKLIAFFVLFHAVVNLFGQQNYGLAFNSFNVRQEKRTSLEIGDSEPLCLSNDMDFSFDFYFTPNRPTYFGYIFRIINNEGQNIDLVYNQKANVFNTIIGGAFCNINFSLDNKILYNKWTHIRYHFTKDSLSCYINHVLYRSTAIDLNDRCLKFVFGTCDYENFATTNVPPMGIRNIGIYDKGELKYFWPLNETTSNNILNDSIHHLPAKVTNPIWTENLHKNWQLLKSFTVKGPTSIAFNQNAEELNIVSEDSVYRLHVNNDTSSVYSYPSYGYHLFRGNQSVYNTVDSSLYNFYIDLQSIAKYSDNHWDKSYDTVLMTQYSHSSRIFLKNEDALYIFGGYGQLSYKNLVQRYGFKDKKWEVLKVKGDFFTPRYMAASGHLGDSIYILGGYGSQSGQQVLKPEHLYDFLLFNSRTSTFKKIYTLKGSLSSFSFAGSMVIDSAHHCYYALCFDDSRYESKLQLLKGSLDSPEYKLLGNTIPYSFIDILSDADLFYCPKTGQLLAVTSLINQEKDQTTINIYTIAFPPMSLLSSDVGMADFSSPIKKTIFLVIGILLFVIVIYYLLKKYRRSVKLTPSTKEKEQEVLTAHSIYSNHEVIKYDKKAVFNPPAFMNNRMVNIRIYLFGTFELIDSKGVEFSNLFSPLLKELFLVILFNTMRNEKGISSDKLNDIFWGDKTGKNAKNNLAVNIVRLKSILKKVGDIYIKKVAEHWVCEYDPNDVSIDLTDLEMVLTKQGEHGREYLGNLLYFVSRGAFLKLTECLWLDNIKAEVNNKIIDKLLEECKYLDSQKDLEYIIETANSIFNFDPLNEEALYLKCKSLNNVGRPLVAQKTYERYIKEYAKIYGEEYSVSYNDLIK